MMTKNNLSKTAIFKKIAVIPLFLVLGLLVINAQGDKTVPTNAPPPPPPPPFGYNMWWTPILAHHNMTPNPSKSWYSKNLYETGDKYFKENDIVTLKDAFILSKSIDNLYRIITAKSAVHDISKKTIKVEGAKIVTYRQENDGDKLIHTEWYKDLSFRIVNDIIAPPPPPPPPPPSKNN